MKCDAHPGLALGSAVFAVDWFDSFTNKQREIERLCERTVPVLPSPTLAGKVGASIAERTCYGVATLERFFALGHQSRPPLRLSPP